MGNIHEYTQTYHEPYLSLLSLPVTDIADQHCKFKQNTSHTIIQQCSDINEVHRNTNYNEEECKNLTRGVQPA
jgi:hypothetical protein